MRKEENIKNIEKEDLCSKLQVHFIENTEAEKSVEDTASTDQISTDSSVKPEECSKRMNKNNSENDAQEAANESKRKHRHENITSQNAEAVEETFYKVTGEAEPERKSHPNRNVILGLLVLILVAGAAISYPIGKEYFQEKSVAGKDIDESVLYANAVSALCCTKWETVPSYHTAAEVKEFMKKHGKKEIV